MKYEDMASWTEEQLKNEVVRLSEECEKKQHEILDLRDRAELLERELDEANFSFIRYVNNTKPNKSSDECLDNEKFKFNSSPSIECKDDCIIINELMVTIDTIVDRYANLRKNKGMC